MSEARADRRKRKTWKNIIKIYLIVHYTLLAKVICKTSFREHNNSLWQVRVKCIGARSNARTRVCIYNHRRTNTPTKTILDIVIIVKYFVSDNRLAAPWHQRPNGEGVTKKCQKVYPSIISARRPTVEGRHNTMYIFDEFQPEKKRNFSRKIDWSLYHSPCEHQIHIRIRTLHRLL